MGEFCSLVIASEQSERSNLVHFCQQYFILCQLKDKTGLFLNDLKDKSGLTKNSK